MRYILAPCDDDGTQFWATAPELAQTEDGPNVVKYMDKCWIVSRPLVDDGNSLDISGQITDYYSTCEACGSYSSSKSASRSSYSASVSTPSMDPSYPSASSTSTSVSRSSHSVGTKMVYILAPCADDGTQFYASAPELAQTEDGPNVVKYQDKCWIVSRPVPDNGLALDITGQVTDFHSTCEACEGSHSRSASRSSYSASASASVSTPSTDPSYPSASSTSVSRSGSTSTSVSSPNKGCHRQWHIYWNCTDKAWEGPYDSNKVECLEKGSVPVGTWQYDSEFYVGSPDYRKCKFTYWEDVDYSCGSNVGCDGFHPTPPPTSRPDSGQCACGQSGSYSKSSQSRSTSQSSTSVPVPQWQCWSSWVVYWNCYSEAWEGPYHTASNCVNPDQLHPPLTTDWQYEGTISVGNEPIVKKCKYTKRQPTGHTCDYGSGEDGCQGWNDLNVPETPDRGNECLCPGESSHSRSSKSRSRSSFSASVDASRSSHSGSSTSTSVSSSGSSQPMKYIMAPCDDDGTQFWAKGSSLAGTEDGNNVVRYNDKCWIVSRPVPDDGTQPVQEVEVAGQYGSCAECQGSSSTSTSYSASNSSHSHSASHSVSTSTPSTHPSGLYCWHQWTVEYRCQVETEEVEVTGPWHSTTTCGTDNPNGVEGWRKEADDEHYTAYTCFVRGRAVESCEDDPCVGDSPGSPPAEPGPGQYFKCGSGSTGTGSGSPPVVPSTGSGSRSTSTGSTSISGSGSRSGSGSTGTPSTSTSRSGSGSGSRSSSSSQAPLVMCEDIPNTMTVTISGFGGEGCEGMAFLNGTRTLHYWDNGYWQSEDQYIYFYCDWRPEAVNKFWVGMNDLICYDELCACFTDVSWVQPATGTAQGEYQPTSLPHDCDPNGACEQVVNCEFTMPDGNGGFINKRSCAYNEHQGSYCSVSFVPNPPMMMTAAGPTPAPVPAPVDDARAAKIAAIKERQAKITGGGEKKDCGCGKTKYAYRNRS